MPCAEYEGDGAQPPPPAPGAGASDDNMVHLEGSLSRSICKQMKTFRETKKLQPELKDKYEHAGGDDECNWYQWEKCGKFVNLRHGFYIKVKIFWIILWFVFQFLGKSAQNSVH